jgi:hypothetical protein
MSSFFASFPSCILPTSVDRYFVTTSMITSFGVVDCLKTRRRNPCRSGQVKEGRERKDNPRLYLRNPNKDTDYLWYYLRLLQESGEGGHC